MLQIDPLTGQTLGGYQIVRLLGQSQLGAAYLAQHPTQGYQAMVTIFHLPEGIVVQEHEQLKLRIAREGEALTRLSHPHIFPIYACGIQPGYVYLITAFAKEASLGQLLKQNSRFSPQQVLPLLKQLAEALDYAHNQGIFHGMLSLSNVIVSDELTVRIAGFGLRSMLEMHGNAQYGRPLAHLSSLNGTFLGSPEYISPERVLGQAIDGRADIYALGVMLFELLSGTQPFSGAQPLDIALQRLQQPVPLLHATCPDVPEAFDIVLGKMLERDPARRTYSAGEAATSFERVLKAFDVTQAPRTGNLNAGSWMQNAQITIPPTVNWFDEEIIPSDPWQAGSSADANFLAPQGSVTGTGKAPALSQSGPFPQAHNNPVSLGGTDPFLWWSSTSTGNSAGTFASHPPQRPNASRGSLNSRKTQQDRRRLVKLITVGSVAAGVVTIGGISLAKLAQSQKNSLSQLANTSQSGSTATSGSTTTTNNGTPAPGSTPGATNTPSSSKSPTAQPTSGKGTQPSPTAKPTQSAPTPPSYTGTIIAHTSQFSASTTSLSFTNPADHKPSWLIHLANGTYVACEQACTHESSAQVGYDSSNHILVCPRHGATFDPANGFAPTSPAPNPLAKVSIHVYSDGTITAG